ncbi:hypothetical protein B0H21DRAFT_717258 [Amylocystis lapponica]|nr:hypothetical protein B0H21DRAFT_717258 [Amylocystis lapponica]
MYRRSQSPTQSSTSVSDNEDEDLNKSAFFAPPDAFSPAQWSSRLHLLPHAAHTPPPNSQASRLPPEILIHILKHLHSSKDLYNALLVSRAWCECSVELLWYRPSFAKLSTLGKMMLILSSDDQTFLYAQFIRRLNFLYLGNELTDSLLSRLAQCVRLERLTLINCSSISDDGLMRVLPCCPNLVALDLTGVVEVTDRSIVALASSARKLQGINLGGCKKLTDKAVLALAADCPLLRRVKLSNVELITDEPISALAKSCPLLLEIDLNNCKNITDLAVRDLWTYSTQMREMRLSHCGDLTDAAFPAPPRPEMVVISPGPNPFPSTGPSLVDKLPPLRLSRNFDHLRMLDLTACSALTDEAIEGIVSVAPKIRNLVLAKCTQLTDAAVENICRLGKHLHYLHLGHAGSITDRSIKSLARSCARLRYIDLANCLQLTDMSVFELSSLQKLRRIGLVRVNNLTDQAIYALADRHATLERIHLSYCDQITVMAVHFLLQKLPKLTHLSLTGIPAFRRTELQQFCRQPPMEFNTSQRSAFCVYSGKGVTELRDFLMELFNSITDAETATATEYEDDYESEYPAQYMDDVETADDGDDDDDDDEDEQPDTFSPHPNVVVTRGDHRVPIGVSHPQESRSRETFRVQHAPAAPRELAMTRDRGNHPISRARVASPLGWLHGQAPSSVAGPSRRTRGFGQQPIIETSSSPVPSDVASNRSTGTNHSNGTAFFRTYAEGPPSARNGVMTPDLIFAEIGHGRGAGPGPSTILMQGQRRDTLIAGTHGVLSSSHSGYAVPIAGHSSYEMTMAEASATLTHGMRLPISESDVRADYGHDGRAILMDSSNSFQHGTGRPEFPATVWSPEQQEAASRSLSSSPTTRELQESVHSALGGPSIFIEGREVDGRGRSVKRSLRSTLTAAEQYASSFFFGGRGSGSGGPEGAAGHANGRDNDPHGH